MADTKFCKLITHRPFVAGPTNPGAIEFINQAQDNSGGLATTGIDFTAAYSDKIGTERLSAPTSWTHLMKYDSTPRPGADIDSSLGEIAQAKDKLVFNLNYDIGDFGVKTTTSFISSSALDDQFLSGYDLPAGSVKVPSKTYLDLQVTYKLGNQLFTSV